MFTTNGHVVHRGEVPAPAEGGPAVRSLSYNAVSIIILAYRRHILLCRTQRLHTERLEGAELVADDRMRGMVW